MSGAPIADAAHAVAVARAGRVPDAHGTLALQRAAGNAATRKLLRHPAGQEKEQQKITIELPGVVDWTPVVSWSFGSSRGRAATDITFNHVLDEDSPKLASAVSTGVHIPQAVLTMRKPSGESLTQYLSLTMNDCIITGFHTPGGGDGGGPSIETITLNFASVNVLRSDQMSDAQGGLGGPDVPGW